MPATMPTLDVKYAVASVFCIATFACEDAHQHASVNAYPVGMTHATYAEVPQPAAWLSPGLRVSGALARRCALRRDDVEAAPHYGFDPAALDPDDEDVLLQLATCLTTGPLKGRTLVLARTADTDDAGADAPLERRAASVQKYLIEYGVRADRVDQKASVAPDAVHRIDVDLAPRRSVR